MAKVVFECESTLLEGVAVECVSRGHKFILDEPVERHGLDQGMNPCEALLAALGACKCIVAGAFAEAHGIDVQELKIQEEGDLDPDGGTGKNPNVKVGFTEIRTTVNIKSSSPQEEIEKFVEFLEKACPVAHTLVDPADYKTVFNIER